MLGKISLSKIRNQFNSLLKNSFSIFSVKILTPISSFVIVLSIAMYLGDSGLGKYSIVFTYYGIFRLISFLGLDNLLTREIVKNKTEVNRYLSNFVIIGLISSVLCYVCMLLLVFVMKYPSDIIAAVSILGFSFFAASGMLICESIFIAFEKVKYTAYAYFVREIVKISLVLLLLKAGGAIPSVISAILIADFTALFIQGFLFDKYIVRFRWELDYCFCKKMLTIIPKFAFISILSSFFMGLDVIILSKIRGAAEVGLYSAAFRFIKIGFIVTFSVATALFPVMAKLFKKSPQLFRQVLREAHKWLVIITIPVSGCIMVFSENIIYLFFGSRFSSSGAVLRIIIWILLPLSTSFIFSRALIASDNQQLEIRALVKGVVIGVVLQIILCSNFGYMGTSAATLISVSIFAALQYITVDRLFGLGGFFLIIRLIISGLLFVFTLHLFSIMNICLSVIYASIVYISSLFFLKVLSVTDFYFIKQVLKGNKNINLTAQ